MDAAGAAFSAALLGALGFGFAGFKLAADLIAERVQSNAIQMRAGAGGWKTKLLVSGFAPFQKAAALALRVGRVHACFLRVRDRLALAGIRSETQGMCSSFLLASLVLLIACSAAGSVLAGAVLPFCAGGVLSAWSSRGLAGHREEVRDSLPEAVRAMGACFHAGFSLSQTFMQLHRELKGPLADLFGRAGYAMEAGASVEEALELVRESREVPELAFVAVALEVQHRSGGSMKHVLDAACESLEGELELRRSLRVHTAQAKLSAQVVTGVTVSLVAVLSLTSEGFLSPFFSSAAGVAMLVCALAMQIAGVLIVRRMLEVEVA